MQDFSHAWIRQRCPGWRAQGLGRERRRASAAGTRGGGLRSPFLATLVSSVLVVPALLSTATAQSPMDQVFGNIATASGGLQATAVTTALDVLLQGSSFGPSPTIHTTVSALQTDPNNACSTPPAVLVAYMNDMFLSFGVRILCVCVGGGGGGSGAPRPRGA
jgi:hypothetical protein